MSTDTRTTYREVFAAPGFAALFGATTLTVLGISLQILAFSVLVFDATGSSTWSSAAFAAGFLPGVVGGLLLPSLADRLPARPLIATGGLVRATGSALLALSSTSHSGVAAGFVVVTTVALVHPLFSSAQSGVVTRLLAGDRYVLGQSLFTITSMVAQLLGLAVGGVVLQALGTTWVLLLAAAMQAGAALLSAVGLPSVPARGHTRWAPGDTLRGYRKLFSLSTIRSLLLLWWVPFALLAGVESLAVPYAADSGAGGLAASALMAAAPLGAMVGAAAVSRLAGPRTREKLVPGLLLLLGAALLPLVASPPAPLAAALIAVASIGLAFEIGGQGRFREALPTGHEALGFGLLGVGMMTGQGLGPLIAGPLADLVRPGPASAIMGGLILASAVFLLPRPDPIEART
ncbi:hypothetical protein GCM10022223_66690 [Kineosporia mesophila]|uniref:MFS transporter n=1 Tax=Kineosporia mesophila TaxID=566012 RepID=A0ABP7AQN6_9ACTN|nr:MFS transporter [Kineosporia mesophila]MCD5349087.1 hypothetical protein [Kineosporia mesophila]